MTRNAGAEVFVTSEDEWYKAAYCDAVSANFFDYPAGTDVQTACAASGATVNTANCNNVVGNLTDVDSYTGSASPNGTFDQDGNVYEWSDTINNGSAPARAPRGGKFNLPSSVLAASNRISFFATGENGYLGFRIANPVSEPPPVPSLSPLGFALLCSGLGWAGLRRRLA